MNHAGFPHFEFFYNEIHKGRMDAEKRESFNLKGLFLRFSPHFQFPLLPPFPTENTGAAFWKGSMSLHVQVVRPYSSPAPRDLHLCLPFPAQAASGVPTGFPLFTQSELGTRVPSSIPSTFLCVVPARSPTKQAK